MVLSGVVQRNAGEGVVMSETWLESVSRRAAAAWDLDQEPYILHHEHVSPNSAEGVSGRWAREVNPARSLAAEAEAEADVVKAVVG